MRLKRNPPDKHSNFWLFQQLGFLYILIYWRISSFTSHIPIKKGDIMIKLNGLVMTLPTNVGTSDRIAYIDRVEDRTRLLSHHNSGVEYSVRHANMLGGATFQDGKTTGVHQEELPVTIIQARAVGNNSKDKEDQALHELALVLRDQVPNLSIMA
jgi:hypothetical protein